MTKQDTPKCQLMSTLSALKFHRFVAMLRRYMDPILLAEKVNKNYGNGAEIPALSDISFAVGRGDSVAIIGKSGSGKSTLMHILATLDRPTSGRVFIAGKETGTLRPSELDELRNKKFGFVFQQFFLNGRHSCLENVELPLLIGGVGKRERRARAKEMLAAVGLADKINQKANDLSGGQKQRLVMARALVTNPEVVFADEPTGNLDTENGRNIIELLFRLQKEKGITLIIVTHDYDLARLCNRPIMLKDGKIVGEQI